jgi:hypothetical protein
MELNDARRLSYWLLGLDDEHATGVWLLAGPALQHRLVAQRAGVMTSALGETGTGPIMGRAKSMTTSRSRSSSIATICLSASGSSARTATAPW